MVTIGIPVVYTMAVLLGVVILIFAFCYLRRERIIRGKHVFFFSSKNNNTVETTETESIFIDNINEEAV